MSSAFAYLEDNKEQDKFSDLADEFKKSEQVEKANKYGNGFAPATSPSQPYTPDKLNARHREIIRLHCLGYKGTEIANMLGCTPQTVYNIVNSPLGLDLISQIQEARTGSVKDVHNRLQEMSPLAAEVTLDLMNDAESETVRLRAAEKVLEMTGHKATDKHQHIHAHLTKDDIQELKDRIRSDREGSGGGEVQQAEEVKEDD